METPNQETPDYTKIFIDYATLKERLPYCDRSLRELIRKNVIPSIVLPGGRKRLVVGLLAAELERRAYQLQTRGTTLPNQR